MAYAVAVCSFVVGCLNLAGCTVSTTTALDCLFNTVLQACRTVTVHSECVRLTNINLDENFASASRLTKLRPCTGKLICQGFSEWAIDVWCPERVGGSSFDFSLQV